MPMGGVVREWRGGVGGRKAGPRTERWGRRLKGLGSGGLAFDFGHPGGGSAAASPRPHAAEDSRADLRHSETVEGSNGPFDMTV